MAAKAKASGIAAATEPAFLRGYRPLLLISLAVLLAYFPTLTFGFSPMDEVWVFLKHLDRFTDITNLPSLFTEPAVKDYYRPIWTSSCMIDASIGHGSPWIFHLTNILVHLAACLLFYFLLLKLNVKKQASLFLSLLFAVHTLNVHAVAWIPGRNDSLLGMFTFAAFLGAILYLENRKIIAAALSLLMLTGALFTKETAIVLTPLLLLYIFHFVEKGKRRPALFLAGGWMGVTVAWFFIRHSIVPTYPAISSTGLGDAVPDILGGLLMQVGKFLLPLNLSVMPTVADTSLVLFMIVLPVFIFLAFRAGLRNRTIALFGLEWFALLIVIPLVSGSVNGNHEHYEHRMYVPSLGLFLFASQLRLENVSLFKSRNSRIVAGTLCFVFLLGNTFVRCRVYRNDFTYAEAGIAESPHKPFFYNTMGEYYAKKGAFTKALGYFNKSIELYPYKGLVYSNRAYVYMMLRQRDNTIRDFNRSLELEPDRDDFRMGRAKYYFLDGQLDSAWKDIRIIESHHGEIDTLFLSHFRKAWEEKKGREELERYTQILKSDTAGAYSYNFRGMAFCKLKRYREALSDFNAAVNLRKDQLDFLFNRAVAYEALGRIDSAYADFKNCYDHGYAINKPMLDEMKKKADAMKR